MEIELNKSVQERILHAVLFEVIANVSIAFLLAWIMNVSVLQSGLLSVISAFTATVWNFVFNKCFDNIQKEYKFCRNFIARSLHAITFEAGLIIILIPVAMFTLNLSVQEAFWIEVGLVLFFLPYTLVFNWIYDYLRWFFVGSRVIRNG
ncbi:Uncharacterized membrane protein [Kosakonia arachidis]|uniref:Uncharacterized membrane protein n=1 Tax=Kosakonia arachidis TaxID=551989 RepID=A0A1I7BBH9_9ENTR|nr:PACE efflux transporter [Kosakonia arachidis]SFT84508.1 Uncharacterized membrane protein [Kosakonia arachidis]